MSKKQIENIQNMEVIFSKLEEITKRMSASFPDWEKLATDYKKLITYYDSKQWKEDVKFSNSTSFPKDIPCGVLSEDGVYNLIYDSRILLISLDNKIKGMLSIL